MDFIDEVLACRVIGRIGTIEILAHSCQFLRAITGKRLCAFVGDAPLMLFAQQAPEVLAARELFGLLCQDRSEVRGGAPKAIVDKAGRLRLARSDGATA